MNFYLINLIRGQTKIIPHVKRSINSGMAMTTCSMNFLIDAFYGILITGEISKIFGLRSIGEYGQKSSLSSKDIVRSRYR